MADLHRPPLCPHDGAPTMGEQFEDPASKALVLDKKKSIRLLGRQEVSC